MDVVAEILSLYAREGARRYSGRDDAEAVSQTEHALQAAALAEREGAPDPLVAAALLHDIGHLIPLLTGQHPRPGVDGRHEAIGAGWLARHFGPEVTEPVRLHVRAKRYLCAAEPDYAALLSPASTISLKLQGGPLEPDERAAFEALPHGRDAVRVRRWDEGAKVAGLAVPPLDSQRARLEALAR